MVNLRCQKPGNHQGDASSWGREVAAPQDTARLVFGHLGRRFSKLCVEGQ